MQRTCSIDEQSFLLAALLLAPHNINDILSFIPEKKREKLKPTLDMLLAWPKDRRFEHLVLEFRRLLLIDEYSIDFIHKSWIEHSLSLEPPYLRALIKTAIAERAQKKPQGLNALVYSSFIKQFEMAKVADPPAMITHLLSLKEKQEEFFSIIGKDLKSEKFFLKEVTDQPEVEIGLRGLAAYLADKKEWQQRIILSLPMNLGLKLKKFIEEKTIDQGIKDSLARWFVLALGKS